MEFFLQKKIEEIRREPEAVRMRYAMIGVFASMVFIFGIWLLSVQDGVSTVAEDVPASFGENNDLIGGSPSLNDLFERAAPLRIDQKPVDGSEFFNQQLEQKNAPLEE